MVSNRLHTYHTRRRRNLWHTKRTRGLPHNPFCIHRTRYLSTESHTGHTEGRPNSIRKCTDPYQSHPSRIDRARHNGTARSLVPIRLQNNRKDSDGTGVAM